MTLTPPSVTHKYSVQKKRGVLWGDSIVRETGSDAHRMIVALTKQKKTHNYSYRCTSDYQVGLVF